MKYNLSILFIILLISISCKHDHDHMNEHDHDEHDHEHHHIEGELKLSKAQIATIGLEYGTFKEIKVNNYINATGTIGVPPNGMTAVAVKADGIFRSSKKFVEGEVIQKGIFVGAIENPDFLILQKNYLQALAALEFLQQELQRQQELVDSQAGVERSLQEVASKVKLKQVEIASIQKELAYLGIKADGLTLDNMSSSIAVVAPKSGYISDIQMHNGMYATRNQPLMHIIETAHLHLELDIFEKDINQVKEGQRITFTLPASGDQIYDGVVEVVGREFNQTAKTVRVHGHIEERSFKFIKDLFVNAKIWLDDDVTTALPLDAIVLDGEQSYVFASQLPEEEDEEVHFEKLMVKTGEQTEGYVAVNMIDPVPDSMLIVTAGAYYINAQAKIGELSHEH